MILFVVVNYYDYQDQKMEVAHCFDCFLSFGVPFKMYSSGGFGGITRFLWLGIIADLLTGLVFSIGLGYICQRIVSRIRH